MHSLLRTEALTPQAVAHELDDFALLFSSRCFRDMGSNGAWAKAQVRYLRHCRTRPRGPKKSTRSTVRSEAGSQLCAGGPVLAKTIASQKRPVVLNGIVAAHGAKQWVHQCGWKVSAGTIGTERLWRNRQRKTKNKSRSCADPITVNLLEMCRWTSEMQSRLLHLRGAVDLAVQPWLLGASERFADILLPGHGAQMPLSNIENAATADTFSEDHIGEVYRCFAAGKL